MSFDYTSLADRAAALIKKVGRSITLIKFDETPADAAKPWRGNLTPRMMPEATVTIDAVFVEPSSATELGLQTTKPDFIDRSTQILIVAPGSILAADLEQYDEVVEDNGVRWKITGVSVLKPGQIRLLYFIGVSR